MGGNVATRSRFFLHMGIAFLVIALIGFSTTFFIPLARGTFSAPAVIHIHGALFFGWLLFFILQATLIHRRRFPVHRQLGWIGLGLAVCIAVSGVLVGLHATRRDLAGSEDPFVLGQFVNILIEMALFLALVAAAVVYRRDGETHKRLLLLATISALAPAWLRFRHFLPSVPSPFITFSVLADSLLVLAMLRDLRVRGSIHRTYVWAGGTMVAIHAIELAAITSPAWLALSRFLLGLDG